MHAREFGNSTVSPIGMGCMGLSHGDEKSPPRNTASGGKMLPVTSVSAPAIMAMMHAR